MIRERATLRNWVEFVVWLAVAAWAFSTVVRFVGDWFLSVVEKI